MKMRRAILIGTACALMLGGAGFLEAAVQDPNAPKLDFPIPVEQRKIAPGDSARFDESRVEVKVLGLERHRARIRFREDEVELQANTPRLVVTDDDRVCTLLYFGPIGSRGLFAVGCEAATDELRAEAQRQAERAAAALESPPPLALVEQTAVGGLANPYRDDPAAVAEGRKYFLGYSCNGCHGGSGGGGMGPPLSNPVWVYGCDDDTLFRLITLGSEGLQGAGYVRKGRENVVGPMPPFGELIETSDEVWKIVAFVQSLGGYDPERCRGAGGGDVMAVEGR